MCTRTHGVHVRMHVRIFIYEMCRMCKVNLRQVCRSRYILLKTVNQITSNNLISPYPVPAKGCVNFENSCGV